MLGNSLLAERLTASQEGISSMELDSCIKAEKSITVITTARYCIYPKLTKYSYDLGTLIKFIEDPF
jgi:hypothetical protein